MTRASVPVTLVEGVAERLPFDPGSFDSAIVTYSLCSMDDPVRALVEVRRVLRPGGELVFVEHGLAPDAGTRWWQRRLSPIWRRIAGGCRLDRDPPALLRGAGFAVDELTAGYSGTVRGMSYTYQGTARPAYRRGGPRCHTHARRAVTARASRTRRHCGTSRSRRVAGGNQPAARSSSA